jgi:hypothetical protein
VISSFVYNIGSSAISKLCKRYYPKENGLFYMQNLCKNSANEIPQTLFWEKQNEIREKNSKIVLFPYPDAINVPPVFFTEHPHPLPGSKVSGYPVSVQFNPAFYKKVKLKKFRLFDIKGKEVKKCKILTQSNDKNHRFTSLQFALMPLRRLDYGTTYRVEFEAIANGKRVKKSWRFTTQKPKGNLYKITKKQTEIKVKRGEKTILYFEPSSNKDVLDCIHYTDKLDITCLDQNTLEIMISKRSSKDYTLKAGRKRVILSID